MIAATILAILPACLSVTPASAQLPPVPPSPPPAGSLPAYSQEEIAATATLYDIGQDEAEERLQRQPYLPALRALALASYGATYGGAWIDNMNGGAIALGFVTGGLAVPDTGSDLQAQLQADALHLSFSTAYPHFADAEFVGVGVAHSAAELLLGYQLISSQLEALRSGGVSIDYLDIDFPRNVVELIVPTQDDAQAVASSFGSLPIEIRVADAVLTEHHNGCSSRSDCHSLRGGIVLQDDRQVDWCTSSFIATNVPQGGSNTYVLSAGHCFEQGEIVHHDELRIGGAARSIQEQILEDVNGNLRYVDAARIFIEGPSGNDLHFTATPRIFVTSHDTSRVVKAVMTPDDIGSGDTVCQSGRITHYRCYEVTSPYTVHYDEERGQYRFYSLEYWDRGADGILTTGENGCKAMDGDSGAPVFLGQTAYGILSGSFGFDDQVIACVATHALHAEEALEVGITTV